MSVPNNTSSSRTFRTTFALVAILGLAAFFRFYGLTSRGIFDYDEGWYLLESKSLYDAGRFTLGRLDGSIAPEHAFGKDLKAYLKERGTVPITSFKPGHNLLVLIGFLLFGVHDYAALFVSALCGVLTVWCVYLLGRDAFDRPTGLLAALVLAVSGFHIAYSRSAYGQASSILFVALGAWLWYRAIRRESDLSRDRLLAGLSIGFAFTCHYNTGLVPFLFLGLETLAACVHRLPVRRWFKRTLGLGLAMLAPLLAFELPGFVLKSLHLAPAGFYTYFEQFFHRNTQTTLERTHVSLAPVLLLLDRFLRTEGLLVLLAAALGLVLCFRHLRGKPLEHALVLGLALIPALPWFFIVKGTDVRFRLFPVTFPALALLAGVGLTALVGRLRAVRIAGRWPASACLTAGFAAVLLFTGARNATDIFPLRSGYREATNRLLAYVETHGGTIGFRPGSAWPIWNFYLSARYDTLPASVRKHIAFYAQKDDLDPAGDYEPIDFWRYYRGVRIPRPKLLARLDSVRETAAPVVRVPNPMAASPTTCFEAGGHAVSRALRILRTRYPQATAIEIYDLRKAGKTDLAVRGEG